jgi:hypothetical protein
VLAEGPDVDTGHGSRGAGFCDASLVLDDAGIGADIVEDLEQKALVGGHLELLVDSATERGDGSYSSGEKRCLVGNSCIENLLSLTKLPLVWRKKQEVWGSWRFYDLVCQAQWLAG